MGQLILMGHTASILTQEQAEQFNQPEGVFWEDKTTNSGILYYVQGFKKPEEEKKKDLPTK